VVFSAIRAVPDVIVVASGTVIAENYRTAQTTPEIQKQRVASGQSAIPRITIVTQSLRIDRDHRVFEGPIKPIIITSSTSPLAARATLAPVADLIIAGEGTVDLDAALIELAKAGAQTVLLEGGPTLNGAFVDADLIDELCLSFAPMMLGGDSPRIVAKSTNTTPHPLTLDRILHQDGYLFHRYLRQR
jgi:riboflavin biosynthesis pyrimidine reductase